MRIALRAYAQPMSVLQEALPSLNFSGSKEEEAMVKEGEGKGEECDDQRTGSDKFA